MSFQTGLPSQLILQYCNLIPGCYWKRIVARLQLVLSFMITCVLSQTFHTFIKRSSVQAECQGPWASCLGIFFVFVNMGPYGSQNFKTLLLTQISFESFQIFSEISSQWSWQKYWFGFLKFWVFDFSGILFVFFNMGPYGGQNFKTLLFPQINFESFETFSEFSSHWSWQKYCFGFPCPKYYMHIGTISIHYSCNFTEICDAHEVMQTNTGFYSKVHCLGVLTHITPKTLPPVCQYPKSIFHHSAATRYPANTVHGPYHIVTFHFLENLEATSLQPTFSMFGRRNISRISLSVVGLSHYTDRRHINSFVRSKRQTLWDVAVNNKLHAIQPSLGSLPGSRRNTRREEIILAITRLGHTYLTHSYLLKREDQPECVGCACPLTVQHIMIECVEFSYIRSLFFNVRNMKDLFDSVTHSTILLYVRAIGLFFKMWLDILPSFDHNNLF